MGVSRLTLALTASLALLGCASDARDVGVTTAALRPDDPDAGDQSEAFEPGVELETLDGDQGAVRVHFTREGQHAVPALVPDYAQEVADEYEAALAFYRDELGFLPPLADDFVTGGNGGDARLDVYLIDFATSADGAFRIDACLADEPQRCAGHMIHENDFDGRSYSSLSVANRTIASHELFHAIQHAYNANTGIVLGEGSAVWASETYAPELLDFELLIAGYFDRPERSLGQEPTGPVDAFSYGTAIFFRFLEERFSREVQRELWEALRADEQADASSWLGALDGVLIDEHDSSLADAFADFVRWNLYTGTRTNAAEAYAEGARYPQLVEREVELPFNDDRVRVFPLSARYYVAELTDDADVVVEVTENEASIAGLRLLLALEAEGEITEVATHEVEAGTENRLLLHGARGERVHAALLSTQRQGESLQPALCFGRAGDDTPCRPAEQPDADVDAGSVDDAGGDPSPASSSGGGCSSALPAKRPAGGGLASALFALGLVWLRLVIVASRSR